MSQSRHSNSSKSCATGIASTPPVRRWTRARLFFFNDTATTEIYTLSLHDALPICTRPDWMTYISSPCSPSRKSTSPARSEEHTSELQSRSDLVCRLLLEKKKR